MDMGAGGSEVVPPSLASLLNPGSETGSKSSAIEGVDQNMPEFHEDYLQDNTSLDTLLLQDQPDWESTLFDLDSSIWLSNIIS
jgi:hypothetical protein